MSSARRSRSLQLMAAVFAVLPCTILALHHPCEAASLASCRQGIAAVAAALLGTIVIFRMAGAQREAAHEVSASRSDAGAIAVLRHDLRNRVNVVKAYAELLGRSESIDDKQRRYAEKIRAGMIDLVAAIESGEGPSRNDVRGEKCA